MRMPRRSRRASPSWSRYWAGYEDADLVCVPPAPPDKALPWNWKLHVENFTDAYHPEFVHKGTHDFAPSVGLDGGVKFTPMARGRQLHRAHRADGAGRRRHDARRLGRGSGVPGDRHPAAGAAQAHRVRDHRAADDHDVRAHRDRLPDPHAALGAAGEGGERPRDRRRLAAAAEHAAAARFRRPRGAGARGRRRRSGRRTCR